MLIGLLLGASLLTCFDLSISTHIIYVNSRDGKDGKCGNATLPCKTLTMSWSFLRTKMIVYGDILFKLAPGYYDKAQDDQPLGFDCLHSNITSLGVSADWSNETIKGNVEICQSFRISNCNVSFIDVHFVNIQQGVHFDHSATIQMKNCKFINNTHYPLISIDTADATWIENMEFSYNVMANEKGNAEFKEINRLKISNLLIKQNKNFHMIFKYVKFLQTLNLTAVGNEDFSIDVTDSVYNATDVYMADNHGNKVSQNFVKLADNTTANMKHVIVRCNKYKDSKYGSVFQVQENSRLRCTDCVAVECKVRCGGGEELTDEILCTRCPTGTSAHDWEKTCKSCRFGYYSAKEGSIDCLACAGGTYCSKLGCVKCKKCNNDFFTSTEGSSSCSRMSTLFSVLLGVVILLTFSPIIVIIVRKSQRIEREDDDENDDDDDERYIVDNYTSDERPLVVNDS